MPAIPLISNSHIYLLILCVNYNFFLIMVKEKISMFFYFSLPAPLRRMKLGKDEAFQ
jgi:hypothetical protein